jgi:hypothetical protein
MRSLLHIPIVLLLTALVACDDSHPLDSAQVRDRGPSAGDGWLPDAGLAVGDEGIESSDATPEAGVLCALDEDCGDRAWCGAGLCQPNQEIQMVSLPLDGVTRVGAAGFDLTPPYWERWIDRAGPACPNNRPDRFEGRLDQPNPEDPCLDAFEDSDGDGFFDAIWLGGDGADRPAEGVDPNNPPAGRALVLARDGVLRIWITLDVHAVDAARVADFERRLRARLGVDEGQVVLHATGTRSGPDAVGLAGPSLALAGGDVGTRLHARLGGRIGLIDSVPFASGVDPAWWQATVERAATAAHQALRRAEPAQIKVAVATLPLGPDGFDGGEAGAVPDADGDGRANSVADLSAWRDRLPWLVRDDHLPPRRDARVGAVLFESTVSGRVLASVLVWAAAPAATVRPLLSGDVAGAARMMLESHLNAPAVWLTGANADTVLAGRRAFVPQTDEVGRPIDAQGRPVEVIDAAPAAVDPAAALGRFVAGRALAALAVVPAEPAILGVRTRYAWLPITNPRIGLAARLGVLGPFGDWLSGRVATRAWSSGAMTPACGGLGCARYRLERLDLGPVSLLSTPGALDGGLARGSERVEVDFADARNLRDLDNDGVPDAVDDEIHLQARGTLRETSVHLPGPLNPQRVEPSQGLGGERIWLVGRTNGGLGSMRPALSAPAVFEGQLEALVAFVQAPQQAGIAVCQLGYPCQSELDLGTLTELTLQAHPVALADVPGGHELRLVDGAFVASGEAQPWSISGPDGVLRGSGQTLVLGPGDRAYAADADLYALGVQPGDLLHVPGMRQRGFEVAGLVPVVLRDHPNTGDAWHASSAASGDLIYNVTCELLHDGACPQMRPVADGQDPSHTLPRGP